MRSPFIARAFVSFALVAAVLASPGCIIVDDADSSLTVRNRSDYVITEIRVTEIDNPNWGPNLLRGDVLFPNEELTVLLRCDVYDVLVVDEDDFGCELHALDLCFSDAVWVIRNSTLDGCF